MTDKSCTNKSDFLGEIITLDPKSINPSDKDRLIVKLLNLVEQLLQKGKQQEERIKELEDIINRLKGEKGRPKIKPNFPRKDNDISKPRQPEPNAWNKASKNDKVKIDRTEVRRVDKKGLPSDAIHKGYRSVIIQNAKLVTDNVEYRLERFYSPSEGRLYEAELPDGLQGSQFGNELKALIHFLDFRGRVTQNRFHGLLRDIGISISEGQISNILTKEKADAFAEEKQEIFEEGMKHADHFNTDTTGGRHKGMNYQVHVFCSLLFTTFFIKPRKDSETIEEILNLSGTNWKEKIMISDDARQYLNLTMTQALCWIHEIRHYRKLNPFLDCHRDMLHNFLTEIWAYYFTLWEHKKSPGKWKKEFLGAWFDKIFSRKTGYGELDERIALTREKKDRLLTVLDHPHVPLHNNDAELPVREPVIKRNISYGTRSEAGLKSWENMLSISDTCRKLGVSFYAYLNDRFSGRNEIPRLATIIAQHAS